MISVEEALKRGTIVGIGEKSDFIVTAMATLKSSSNALRLIDLQKQFNQNLKINSYSKKRIKHLTFTSIIYENFETGVIRYEQKYYNKKEKNLSIDLRNSYYEQFCQATKKEAQQIMASEILRGTKKFLQDEKDFNYKKFYADLETLFKKEGLV